MRGDQRDVLIRYGAPWWLRGFLTGVLLALLAFGPAAANAQEPTPRFERLTVDEGLSHNSGNSILQDRYGFIWIGTDDGLNKYDGYNLTVYRSDPEDPRSLSANMIVALYEDSSGELWVGTRGGLNRFDRATQTFTRYQHDPANPQSLSNDQVGSIVEDAGGTLWVGTRFGGINRFDRATQTFRAYVVSPDAVGGLLYRDSQGTLWLGNTAGLHRVDPATGAFTRVVFDPDTPAPVVFAICEDREGLLWLGTDEGLFAYDSRTGRVTQYRHDPADPQSLSGDSVSVLYEDRSGTLWVGTYGDGINRFDRRQQRFRRIVNDPANPHSLVANSIMAIQEDRTGLLWIGTGNGGVSIFNPATAAFQHYTYDPTQRQSISGRNVSALYQDRAGVIWVGVEGSGLNAIDRAHATITVYRHDPSDPASLSNDTVLSIAEDRNGTLWVGTMNGLSWLDRTSGRFTVYRHDPANPSSLSNDVVQFILHDRAGQLWIATEDGLNRFDRTRGRFTVYRHDPADPSSLSRDDVTALYQDADGAIWASTWGGGLNRLDPAIGSFRRYRADPNNPQSLGDDYIVDIVSDAQGHLWLATTSGAERLDLSSGTFRHYRQRDGLPTSAVACLQIDAAGRVWVGTSGGLVALDPAGRPLRLFTARDGLQSNELTTACGQGSQGELIFGGANGLSIFDPETVLRPRAAPPVVLTAFSIFNRPVALGRDLAAVGDLTLSWRDAMFSFDFAALDYADPRRNRYAYKLEGFDTDWIDAGTHHSATYTNLPGGEYIFRVKAANSAGVWNEQSLALRVHITPPPWATWWAYGLYVLAFLGVVGGYVRARSRVQARRLREREQQRLYQVAEGLREVLAMINANRPLPDILNFMMDQAVRLLGAAAGQMYQLQPGKGGTDDMLSVVASQGFAPGCVGTMLKHASLTASHRAIAERRAITITDMTEVSHGLLAQPTNSMRQSQVVAEKQRCCGLLAVPLLGGGETYGAITLYSPAQRMFTSEEVALATAFAAQSALAIKNVRLREQVEQAAVIEERNRLARDLHDSVTQALFSLNLIAESCRYQAAAHQQCATAHDFGRLSAIAQQALKEMRLLIYQLRSPLLAQEGLVGALRRRLEAVERRAGMKMRLLVEDEVRLGNMAEEQLYRIIQEALNNTLKHAGAHEVTVQIERVQSSETSAIVVTVQDDGVGFDPSAAQHGIGLSSMRERTAQLQGKLTLTSAPGAGTTLQVVVPYQPPDRRDREQFRKEHR